jgi:hypothetical protein
VTLARFACLIILSLATSAAAAAGPKTIFDDDWTPPKPTESPRATTTPRRPIPSKPEQSAVRKLMRELYDDDLKDHSPAGRLKLADKLLEQSAKSAAQPVDQFVILVAAIDSAVEAANLARAFDAADQLAASFDVDGPALKADAATRVAARPATPGADENVRACLRLATDLVATGDFTAAARVCAAAQSFAGNNADLRTEIQKRTRDVGLAREARARVAKDFEKLKAVPDDPAANLSVGKYLCFTTGDFKAGLPALAKGSDPALKSLAQKELAPQPTPDTTLDAADGWWDFAERGPAANRDLLQAHAAELYAKAVPQLQGLARAKAAKRLSDWRARETARALYGGTIWKLCREEPDKLFPADFETLPDELTVDAAPLRVRISGKKVIEKGKVAGKDVHHIGKAVTYEGQDNAGTLEAAVPFLGDHTHYFLVLVGKDGKAVAKELRAAKGVTYTWRVGNSGKDRVLAVYDKGQVIASATMPAADAPAYGFAVTVRYKNDPADIVVTRQR